MVSLEPLGDRAFLAHFGTEREAARWAAAVRALRQPGVTDVVLAYRSAAVFADPDRVELERPGDAARRDRGRARRARGGQARGDPGPLRRSRPRAGGRHAGLGARRGRRPPHRGHIRRLRDRVPSGFPVRGVSAPPRFRGLARRDEPRLKVPAGSVAIAGRQTGIYPRQSPGGWHLLGRTPLRIAEPEEGYFPIRGGPDPVPFHRRGRIRGQAR